jgi:nickel/cobalt exporter
VLAIAATVVGLHAAPAQSHPFGNFSLNRFSALEIFEDKLVVHYVVDMAELPTFQELAIIDADRDERVESLELQTYAADLAKRLLLGVRVRVGDEFLPPRIVGSDGRLRPGNGSLNTLRIEADYEIELSGDVDTIRYLDLNYSSFAGWKEVIAYAQPPVAVKESTVPTRSVSNALRSYPRNLLKDPPQVRSALIELGRSSNAVEPNPSLEKREGAPPEVLGDRFASLIESSASLPGIAVALLLALGLGAAHALGPGHGKSVMAAYLLGSAGRIRDAVAAGIAVSLMHTFSVAIVGLALLKASELFPAQTVFKWLSLAAGLVVLSIGAWLLTARLRRRSHHHEHEIPPDPSPLTARGLTAIAFSGGLLPSPSALVVLLSAVALGRIGFGVLLVAAFGLGLAAALAILGVAVVRARRIAGDRLGPKVARLAPVASAAVVLVVGVLLTARAALLFRP